MLAWIARVAELEAENNGLAEVAEEYVNTAHRYRDALEQIRDAVILTPDGARDQAKIALNR